MVKTDKQTVERIKRKASQSACVTQIAAFGFNKSGICVAASTNRARFYRKGGGDHAERLVMADAKKKGIVHILICRVGKGGDPRPIEPCDTCQQIADKLGIVINTVPEEADEASKGTDTQEI